MHNTDQIIMPGLDIVVTTPEHAFDHVIKRVLKMLIYRSQIFLVKYEYLRSLQNVIHAYMERLRHVLTILRAGVAKIP